MNQKLKERLHWVLILLVIISGCNKYLDQKSDKTLSTISTLADAQSLLEQYNFLSQKDVACSEISAGDYYLTETDLASREEYNRRLYLWQDDNVFVDKTNDWYYTYFAVFVANTVIGALNKIERTGKETDWDNTMGQAYYFRGRALMSGVFAWCLAYDLASASTTPGLPLRQDADFNLPSVRSTLQQTYAQIEEDLHKAASLMPVTSVHVLRPNKVAALGLLARLYLSMGDYEKTKLYADSSLLYNNYLMDYNDRTIITNPSAAYPMPLYNKEILSEYRFVSTVLLNTRARIDSTLYQSYISDDWRKTLFFKTNTDGSVGFKGSYSQTSFLNTSICTDELYLMLAETKVRTGQVENGLQDLDTLLSKRWKTGTYVPTDKGISQDSALNLVLQERRKELLMRGLRWMDIKRLNVEGRQISLRRTYNGEWYPLDAGSKRFAIPIPDDIILSSSIEQNQY